MVGRGDVNGAHAARGSRHGHAHRRHRCRRRVSPAPRGRAGRGRARRSVQPQERDAGLAGANDMREVHRLADAGDDEAALALEVYCHRLRKYVGAYFAVLGGVDAVAFTAGVGENDARVRAAALAGLEPSASPSTRRETSPPPGRRASSPPTTLRWRCSSYPPTRSSRSPARRSRSRNVGTTERDSARILVRNKFARWGRARWDTVATVGHPPEGFEYVVTSNGDVRITHHGRLRHHTARPSGGTVPRRGRGR